MPVPPVPCGVVSLRRPPETPRPEQASPLARLLPLLMLVAAGGMVVLYLTAPSGSGNPVTRSPMYLLFPAMMVVSVLGTLAHGNRGRGAALDAARRDYLRYLDTVSADAADTAQAQHVSAHWTHPDPAMLWTLVGGRRMWERRRDDPEFGRVRVGVGPGLLATTFSVAERDSVAEPDPVTEDALDEVLTTRAVVPNLPITVELSGHLGIGGDREDARNLLRAMVCQLAVLHSPADVRISARAAACEKHWDWLKWLPHHRAPHSAACTVATTVLIIDDDGPPPAGVDQVVLDLGGRGDAVIDAGPESDGLSQAQALMCARRLARWSPEAAAGRAGAAVRGWAQLIGVDDLANLQPPSCWRSRSDTAFLRVPIGLGDGPDNQGMPVYLDLKEAAQQGMGPHGLCVGATGSGKSEFLRTLVLGLVAAHPPDELNLALIDFKGGATFLGFEKLRHVAAVITNLADESYLVSRMQDALTGEMHRRQQLLRTADAGSIGEYRRARQHDADLPALPVLFMVIDEFSELLSRHPDFAELFLAVGRLGRSLGMHLLLASQRLDEGKLRGLETHLSYRVCLKTFSTSESRAVLGVPDAHHLPATPGAAYLKTADGSLVRLRTAFVSGPSAAAPAAVPDLTVRKFRADVFAAQQDKAPQCSGPTVLSLVLNQLAGHGRPAHPIWLPPLATPLELDTVLALHDGARLTAPVGLVDNPLAQRRDVLTVDMTGAGGHVAVVGATRSGKSTAVCTLLLALAATHSPAEIQFYCLDFGGGALTPLGRLPHTGVVAGRGDGELARRTIAQLQALIRRRSAGGTAGGDGYGEVFLVVDGWAVLRQEGDGLEDAVTELAAHGLAHGVHVIVTAARWAELRPAIKDQLGSRIELRLGEPTESELDRKAARHLVDSPPGTGLTRDARLAVLALPRVGGADVTGTVAAVRNRCPGRAAIPVRLLPAILHRASIPLSGATASTVVIGIGESELRPVAVDFAESSHLIVLGDSGCGKTGVLRTLCAQLTQTCAPDAVQLYLTDVRRTLLGAVESAHLGGYAMSTAILQAQLPELVARLRARMPGAAVTQRQLRDRSWWSGPEIYVIVDDYELVAGPAADPLTPLLEFLPYARDIGLHLVIARRAGGAARALFNPVPATMRELGGAGLLMSAGPDEGVLLGSARPTPLPPGRAALIIRGRPEERVQIAWTEPT